MTGPLNGCVCVSVYIYEILKYMNNDVENNFF